MEKAGGTNGGVWIKHREQDRFTEHHTYTSYLYNLLRLLYTTINQGNPISMVIVEDVKLKQQFKYKGQITKKINSKIDSDYERKLFKCLLMMMVYSTMFNPFIWFDSMDFESLPRKFS